MKTEIPDLKSQVKIAKVLTISKQEISTLKQTADQYRLQKRGLMQKLLTGEWQIPEKSQTAKEATQKVNV